MAQQVQKDEERATILNEKVSTFGPSKLLVSSRFSSETGLPGDEPWTISMGTCGTYKL